MSNVWCQVALLGHRQVLNKTLSSPLTPAEDVGDDLALLAACNHTVLSYGTFGQWAALLRPPSQSARTVMMDQTQKQQLSGI